MMRSTIILQIVAAVAILGVIGVLLPQPTQAAFSLVPCGRSGPYVADSPTEPCQLKHLFKVIVLLINYLVSMAALVAIYQIMLAGFGMARALGNAESIQHHKEGLRNAIVGFAIVVLSFVLINLLINGVFGSTTATRPWWNITCIYDITNTTGCSL